MLRLVFSEYFVNLIKFNTNVGAHKRLEKVLLRRPEFIYLMHIYCLLSLPNSHSLAHLLFLFPLLDYFAPRAPLLAADTLCILLKNLRSSSLF